MEINDSDIVISGISGRYPSSNNVQEFMQNLYNKVDMVDDDESRWRHFRDDVPKRFGKIRNLEKFDASFFSTLNKHANWTDPQMRILLEHAYEAILDAGISPQSLIGTKTGVFIGCSISDSKDFFIHGIPPKEGYVVLGNGNFYLSNRISYALGLCGPSLTLDTACSSSAYALDCAFRYLESGLCDSALVGGTQLILACGLAAEYTKLGILAGDGVCRPFDANASGFTRAETICVVFLQKRKDSKRIYANLVYSSSNNDGFKKEGSSFPSKVLQQKLIEDFYRKINFDPKNVNFVEAHATGTKLGDPEEVAAIDAGFCKSNRSKPLVIGSVKSNMGHAEAASGMASLSKILMSFENRKFPPNINLQTTRSDIPAFSDGRITVATDAINLEGDYIAMNSFGLGGANAHSLFRGNSKTKINFGIPTDNLDRVVLWSGRTEEAVNAIFNDITKRPLDAEYVALLQGSQVQTTGANTYRGYGIFSHDDAEKKAVCIKRDIQYFNGTRHPIVFVYSGVGSQWIEMGRDLLKIPLFSKSIDYCHDILKPKGIDLKNVITSTDKDTFNNILNSFVGIIAIEIALTDILKAIGIKPDFIIGHSVGEISCAYADDCFTAEEAILAACARGEASRETDVIPGAMAAVGIHYSNLQSILPHDIDIACHNAEDSTTISGPVDSISKFVMKLKNDGIFAKEIPCSGIPLHSRYITKIGQKIREKLEILIKEPKKRSQKWLSSTFPKEFWDNKDVAFSSSEYHAKNLLNPVYFYEVSKMLPKDSLIIEIAPHELLKPILKRNMKSGVYSSLAQRNCKNGVEFLMNSLGSLFQHGVDMDISKLYPTINFPVSRGTPMISHLIKWNHEVDHFIPHFDSYNTYERRNIVINISDKKFEYIQGHIVDGRILFPATGWIFLAWETFSMMICEHFEKVKVIIEDVHFLRATSLAKNQDVTITITIHRGSGKFEIVEGNSPVAHGTIRKADDVQMSNIQDISDDGAIMLTEDDFYKEMRLVGFCHLGVFKGVKEIRHDGMKGKIKWNSWITFIDSMTHFEERHSKSKKLGLPTSIRKIIIDPILHKKLLEEKIKKIEVEQKMNPTAEKPEILFDVIISQYLNIVQSGGIEFHDKRKQMVNRRRPKQPLLETQSFIPFFPDQKYSMSDAVKILVQTVLENTLQLKFSSIELKAPECAGTQILSEYVAKAIQGIPQVVSNVTFITSEEALKLENVTISNEQLSTFNEVDLVIGSNCIGDNDFIETAKAVLNSSGYIISRENEKHLKVPGDLQVVAEISLENHKVVLYMLKFKNSGKNIDQANIIEITSNVDGWLKPLQSALKNSATLIYGYNKQPCGILGLINCIRREYPVEKLICFFIIDTANAPSNFDLSDEFFKKQFDLNHSINVFKDGKWGSYRYMDIPVIKDILPQARHCFVNCHAKGDLSQLSWVQGPLDVTENDIIKIQYASLNFKDVMLSLGRIPDDCDEPINQQSIFGFEFSGIRNNGERIMGIGTKAGAMATHYDEKDTIYWTVPDSWTLEEAATVPLVYFTVYFAFFNTCKIKAGKKILIHSGSGGVGQAAIEVALAYNLEVFTTVSTEEKKNFLLKKFPSLKPENIGNSRDISFEKMIMKNTQRKGVDYVLNSLADEKLQASIRCLGTDGIFLEIGKYDIVKGTNLNLNFLAKRITLRAVNFDDLSPDSKEMTHVYDLVAEDIKAGIIKPLNTTVFGAHQIEEAFRFMANGKHIGKILLKIRENENDDNSLPLYAINRVYFNPNESVVIVGGFGGFAMELIEWVVGRGCRKLVLGTRRGVVTSQQKLKILLLKHWGVKYIVSTADVSTQNGCDEILQQAKDLGPIGAIFNLAGVLRDGIFDNLNTKMFSESMAPKALATLYLNHASRVVCPNLKHFIVFSSVSCGRGNAGQSNYGMANSVMERIVEQRRQAGFSGKAIQWGAIGDVGMLAEFQLANMDKDVGGTLPQAISSCLESMDTLLTAEATVVSSMVIADKQAKEFKKGNVIDAVLNIMGVRDKKSVSMDSTLTQLGIDSLMGVEIQQILEREFDVTLSSQELRSLTLSQLKKRISNKNSVDSKDKKSQVKEIDELEWMRILMDGVIDLENIRLFTTDTIVKANKAEFKDSTKVLIVPGFYGFAANVFHKISKSIKYPAYILQLLGTAECNKLNEIIEKLTPEIIKLYADADNFIFIGHSFGATLCLTFAKILEDQGKSGHVIELDGSPQFINRFADKMMTEKTEEGLKSSISTVLFNIFAPSVKPNVAKLAFENHENWIDRMKALIEMSSDEFPFNFDYFLNQFIMPCIFRCYISQSVTEKDFSALKNTTISLIKATVPTVVGMEVDYGLSRYTGQNVLVRSVEGDHVTMLSNSTITESIRDLLNCLIVDERN